MEGADNEPNSDTFFLLCATNCPWELDSAFLRRFEKRIYIPLPDKSSTTNTYKTCGLTDRLCDHRLARIALLKGRVKSTSVHLNEQDWQDLGSITEGFSGSDLATCCDDAIYEPVRELTKVTHWKKIGSQVALTSQSKIVIGYCFRRIFASIKHRYKLCASL
jgi:vacuolar protein-sorting-associated protein 4